MSLSREEFNDIRIKLKEATSDKDVVILATELYKIADKFFDFKMDFPDYTSVEQALYRRQLFSFVKTSVESLQHDGLLNKNQKTVDLIMLFLPIMTEIKSAISEDEFLDEDRLFASIELLLVSNDKHTSSESSDEASWSFSQDDVEEEYSSVSEVGEQTSTKDEFSFDKLEATKKRLNEISTIIANLKKKFDSLQFKQIFDEIQKLKEALIAEVKVIKGHFASLISTVEQSMNALTMDNKRLAIELERENASKINIDNAIKSNNIKFIELKSVIDEFNEIIKLKDPVKIGKELDIKIPLEKIYQLTGESQKAKVWQKADKEKITKAMKAKKAELIDNHQKLTAKSGLADEAISDMKKKNKNNQTQLAQLSSQKNKLAAAQNKFKQDIEGLQKFYIDVEKEVKELHRVNFIVPAIQVYKDNFNNYLKQSHKDFRFRDAMGTLFGKNQRKARKAYFDTVLEPALDQYDPDGDNRPLVDALAQGVKFRSRVTDESPQYDKTMQFQLDEIERILIKKQ